MKWRERVRGLQGKGCLVLGRIKERMRRRRKGKETKPVSLDDNVVFSAVGCYINELTEGVDLTGKGGTSQFGTERRVGRRRASETERDELQSG